MITIAKYIKSTHKKFSFFNSSFFTNAIQEITNAFIDCPDLIKKQLFIDKDKEAYIFYLKNIVNIDILQRNFINPLVNTCFKELSDEKTAIKLPISNISISSNIKTLPSEILSGKVVFIVQDLQYAISYAAQRSIQRSIEEPATEKNIKGAHDGFIESLDENIGILRKRIVSSNLKFKNLTVGEITKQTVCIAYIEGMANKAILNELCEKIKAIETDSSICMGVIEQLISEYPFSVFPLYMSTERPDKTVTALMAGQFAIMLDGTPVVLLAPITFFSFFQTGDDYAFNWVIGSFLRIIRYISILITVFLPSLYIAITQYHYYMVPVSLIEILADSRAKVPFPPVIELLIMELAVELLREATVRLPTYIGMTIGVVGGIVIGQAAVEAGIISNLLLIIISFTAIASSVIPNFDAAISLRFVRFVGILFTSIFGIVGTVSFVMIYFAQLVVLEPLGQPYFSPIVPLRQKNLKETFFRFPFKFAKKRIK